MQQIGPHDGPAATNQSSLKVVMLVLTFALPSVDGRVGYGSPSGQSGRSHCWLENDGGHHCRTGQGDEPSPSRGVQ